MHFKGLPVKFSIIPSIILGRDDLGHRKAGNPESRSRNTPHPGKGERVNKVWVTGPRESGKRKAAGRQPWGKSGTERVEVTVPYFPQAGRSVPRQNLSHWATEGDVHPEQILPLSWAVPQIS